MPTAPLLAISRLPAPKYGGDSAQFSIASASTVSASAPRGQVSGAEPSPTLSPIVIFEWEVSPRRSQGQGQSHGRAEANADNLLRWSGSFEAHLGYAPGEFEHTFEAWCAVLHPDDRKRVLRAIEHHLASGEPYYETCRALRRDGTWVQFVHSGVAARDESGAPCKLTGTLSDFVALPRDDETGDKFPVAQSAHEKQVRDEKARAESLLRTAAHLNAQLNLDDVCQAICEEASRTIGAPSAVMLFNKTRDAFVPVAVHNMPRDYDKRYTPTIRAIYERHVAEMGPLFLFTDAQATPDLPNHALYREVNMRTIGIASLIREGEVLGLLKVYSFGESRTFDENELALLQGLADLGAQALANARLYTDSQRRLNHIQSLRQIDLAILGSSEVSVALNVVLDQVMSQLGVDASSILLLNAHSRTLRHAGGRGFRTLYDQRAEWRMGEGLAGRAALERCLIHVPDLNRPAEVCVAALDGPFQASNESCEEVFDQHLHRRASEEQSDAFERSNAWRGEGFMAYYAVPLIAAGRVQGVLEVWQRSSLPLEEEKIDFLETLAGQAAIAVDNASLFRDVQRSHDELMLAYDSTLEGWSRALDLRDKETEGHTQRVTRETLLLAAHMGLKDETLLHMRRGALLHDIGKMGIPDAILLKPGPLTDEEWVIMKRHPTYALELLSPTSYLRPALEIPYAHHEKWDGTGYPLGLSGEQIPLSARIFAVIDVWDALCSDRPYRRGWPLVKVLHHIRDGAGTHFDPQVVQAFLQMHPEVDLDVVLPEEAPSAPPVTALPSSSRRNSPAHKLIRWLMCADEVSS